jgi:hypothetical protein
MEVRNEREERNLERRIDEIRKMEEGNMAVDPISYIIVPEDEEDEPTGRASSMGN